jgi:hypothetical protein
MARQVKLTRCSHCGRDSATVRGICTECWGVKDETKVDRRPRRRDSGGSAGFWDDPFGCLPWGCFPWTALLIALLLLARKRA